MIDNLFKKLGYMPIPPEPDTTGMSIYTDNWDWCVTITKIVVPTEYDKDQLIKGFKYLHDNRLIDTDLMAVNTIVHQYQCPEKIVVE